MPTDSGWSCTCGAKGDAGNRQDNLLEAMDHDGRLAQVGGVRQ